MVSSLCAASASVVTRTTFAGVPVLPTPARRSYRRASSIVVASAEKRQVAVPAAVMVAVGTAMANPLVAQAGVTPTLKNLVSSVIAGSVVLGAIAIAVTAVSNFDPVRR